MKRKKLCQNIKRKTKKTLGKEKLYWKEMIE